MNPSLPRPPALIGGRMALLKPVNLILVRVSLHF